jgi:hypothetical protein
MMDGENPITAATASIGSASLRLFISNSLFSYSSSWLFGQAESELLTYDRRTVNSRAISTEL